MTSRDPVLIIDNHDSYTWNLFQLIWCSSGIRPVVAANDELRLEDVVPGKYSHIVIGPGPGSPHLQGDVGICLDILSRRPDPAIPVMGVCMGFQMIVVALGGTIGPAPQPMHGRISPINHDKSSLLTGLPQGFGAVRYHSLAAHEPLPAGLAVTARAGDDDVVMAVENPQRGLYGVQFHPESIQTSYGAEIVDNFLAIGRTRAGASL
jgi:para-aminobenzoate synthetase